MYSTKYVKARDIDDAVKALKSANDGKFLAGGMTLIPTLKQRLANPDCLVDLSACGLSSIDDEGSAIRIGAMTRHVDVANLRWCKRPFQRLRIWPHISATGRYAIAAQ